MVKMPMGGHIKTIIRTAWLMLWVILFLVISSPYIIYKFHKFKKSNTMLHKRVTALERIINE